MTKDSVLLASGARHLSARPNLEGFTWKGAHGSAPGRRSHWMGAWGGAAGLTKMAGTRTQDAAPCLYHWSQESCALQPCNEPLPFFFF